jgi:hypothetical protein
MKCTRCQSENEASAMAARPGASPVGDPTVACSGEEVNAARWARWAARRHQSPGLAWQVVVSSRIPSSPVSACARTSSSRPRVRRDAPRPRRRAQASQAPHGHACRRHPQALPSGQYGRVADELGDHPDADAAVDQDLAVDEPRVPVERRRVQQAQPVEIDVKAGVGAVVAALV